MASYLCPELIDEIFERLPVKSLVRFRSLSKYWYSRIASPDFIRRQSLNTTQQVLIRHWFKPPRSYDSKGFYTLHSENQFPLDPRLSWIGINGVEFPIGETKIIGSCNGILCLLLSFVEKFNICLWNFSTRRKLTLPDHPSLDYVFAERVTFGFGFDSLTDDYKVVMIVCPETIALVYSMKTDSWSEITFPDDYKLYYLKSEACFFNGILHWVVNGFVNETLITETRDFILTFNLSSLVFEEILLPKEWTTTQVTIINGSLAVISTNGGNTSIWVMKEYDNDAYWCLYYELKMCSSEYPVRVLQPIRNGDLVFHTINDRGNQVYNHETELLSKVLEFRRYCRWVEMVPYVESLELLDRGTPCGETILFLTKKDNHKRKIRLLSHEYDDCYDDEYSDFFS